MITTCPRIFIRACRRALRVNGLEVKPGKLSTFWLMHCQCCCIDQEWSGVKLLKVTLRIWWNGSIIVCDHQEMCRLIERMCHCGVYMSGGLEWWINMTSLLSVCVPSVWKSIKLDPFIHIPSNAREWSLEAIWMNRRIIALQVQSHPALLFHFLDLSASHYWAVLIFTLVCFVASVVSDLGTSTGFLFTTKYRSKSLHSPIRPWQPVSHLISLISSN